MDKNSISGKFISRNRLFTYFELFSKMAQTIFFFKLIFLPQPLFEKFIKDIAIRECLDRIRTFLVRCTVICGRTL